MQPTTPSFKSKLREHMKKLKSKGAAVTRKLLETNKHQQADVRWKTSPYQFVVSKVLKKKAKKAAPPPVFDVIDLTGADEVSCDVRVRNTAR